MTGVDLPPGPDAVAAALDAGVGGGHCDPSFGPLVPLGIGGIAAEIFGDVLPLLLAPPEPGEVAAAAKKLSGRKMLQGIRGFTGGLGRAGADRGDLTPVAGPEPLVTLRSHRR